MRIGTRGSALALAQARWVAERLPEDVEIVVVESAGPAQDKSRWVSALEQALLDGRIDLAVHSAKDVPAELPDGLALLAIPVREDPRDALCGAASLAELRPGARVGTSSLRRAAQLRALRDDLEVIEIWGNVDTRLRKLAEGEVDAIVLALAGLRRLGLQDEAGCVLDELVPAAGQGALALEARSEMASLDALNDARSAACVAAERELTRALGASCDSAVGGYARPVDGGVELTAWVGTVDGSRWISDRVEGEGGPQLGRAVAERLLAVGAAELLAA